MTAPHHTAIVGGDVFDGHDLLAETVVVISAGEITAIGGGIPSGAQVVEAHGCTLLPGLIDAHVHTSPEGLRDALVFGVTTELEMQGHWTSTQRRAVAQADDLADLRSAGFGVTRRGGHPSHWFPDNAYPGMGDADDTGHVFVAPFASTPDEAIFVVDSLIQSGSDYIKIMVEDGHVLGAPGLPVLDPIVMKVAVRAAHEQGKLVVAHALTVAATLAAVAAGVDGLTHLFVDAPATADIVDVIAAAGVFVVPCVVLDSSIVGGNAAAFAADERVQARAPESALTLLRGSFDTYREGRFEDVLSSVFSLHEAGVDILVGTDASPRVPGVAHGASVHHELQLLTTAGLTPREALSAATSVPATRFGLTDRGTIRPGMRADLVLIEGNPAALVSDSLSLRQVWKRGVAAGFGQLS